jgi:hypothetical protein
MIRGRISAVARVRDHPTPLVSSSSRRWFLDDYRAPRGSREVSLGKHTELRTDAVAYTPACPTDMGFTAVGQLTPGPDASHSASLSLGSVLHRWTSTGRPLAGLATLRTPVSHLWWVSSVRTPRGLDYYTSHLVVLCACRAHQGCLPFRRRFAALTRPIRSRSDRNCGAVGPQVKRSKCRFPWLSSYPVWAAAPPV